MFNHVATAAIIVSDQDKAKDFYVNTLGFILRSDSPLFPGAPNRWLTVVPNEGATTEILLDLASDYGPHFRHLLGNTQGIFISVTNLVQLYNDLKAKGVEFTGEPDVQPWGSSVFLKDPDGNQIMLVEPPTGNAGR